MIFGEYCVTLIYIFINYLGKAAGANGTDSGGAGPGQAGLTCGSLSDDYLTRNRLESANLETAQKWK